MSEAVLTAKKCTPCQGSTPAMTPEQAGRYLASVPQWRLVDDATRIVRTFQGDNFIWALTLANRIGAVCEEEGHHPDLSVGWGYCTVAFQTHSIKGLHENDFIMAAKVNQLGESLGQYGVHVAPIDLTRRQEFPVGGVVKTVAQALKSKAIQTVAGVSPSATARDAARLMAEYRVGALLVMDQEQIVGIVSERDFARKLVPFDWFSGDIAVAKIMTAPVMYVDSAKTCEECMALMTNSRLRHLPVLEQGKLVGLISIGDLVKEMISDQQFVIEQLVHYITDTRV